MPTQQSPAPEDKQPKKGAGASDAAESTGEAAAEKPEKKVQKTVNDYVDLIETVARVEYSRLPNHLIDYSELVNIGAIAIHVLLTSNPEREFNVTYLSTAIKWAVRNELRYRYKWYSFRSAEETTETPEKSGDESGDGGGSDDSFEMEKGTAREAVYATILSVDSMMEAENPHEIKDDSYTPEENTEMKEMAKIVRECITKLPERERMIIEARFFHNKKMREIGEQFQISPSRISRIVQSGLDKIKKELKRRGYASL